MTSECTCDNLTKLSRKRQAPTRKRRNEPWQINNNATLKILAIKVFKRTALGRMLGRSFHKLAWWKVMTNIRKCESIWKPNADEQIYLWVWENSNWTEKMQIFKPKTVSQMKKLAGQLFNMRVWSWLRMNAGGVLNTCKSNGQEWNLVISC